MRGLAMMVRVSVSLLCDHAAEYNGGGGACQ